MDIDMYEASCSEHISREAFIASVNAVLSNVTPRGGGGTSISGGRGEGGA